MLRCGIDIQRPAGHGAGSGSSPRGPGAVAEVHVGTLRRAAEIIGGEQELALVLNVTPSHLALWLGGYAEPPGDIFLRAVDLITEHELSRLAVAAPAPASTPAKPKEDLPAS